MGRNDIYQAVRYYKYGKPEVLRVEPQLAPRALPHQALIEVAASNINNMDVMVRQGRMRLIQGYGFPKGIGFDYAGIARTVPRAWLDIKRGMRVWGVLMTPNRAGAMQSALVTSKYVIAPAPRTVSLVDAAALPSAGLTAIQTLRSVGFKRGQRCLVVGGNGGVGSLVIQIARHFSGQVDAVVGHNGEVAQIAGAQQLFNYHDCAPKDVSGPYDVIIGAVELPNLIDYHHALAPGGVLATLAPTSLIQVGKSFATLGRRFVIVNTIPKNKDLRLLTKLVDARVVKPVIAKTYPVEEVVQAFKDFEYESAYGKRVVVFNASLDTA